MRSIIFFLLIIISVSSKAQDLSYIKKDPYLDSLWGVWNNEKQTDTSRLHAIESIVHDDLLYNYPESTPYFTELQYEFAKSKGLKLYMAKARNLQGISFYFQGNYVDAMRYYTEGLEIVEALDDKKGIAKSLNNIGILEGHEDKSIAIEYYNKSLKIREEIGDKTGIASSLNSIGNALQSSGNYKGALEHYKRCLKMHQEMNNKHGIAGVLNNIGENYKAQGDYDQAFKYYTKSLKIRQSIGEKQGIAASLINIGVTYHEKGDYTEAIKYCNNGLKIAKEVGDITGIKEAAQNLFELYEKVGNYKSSLDMHKLYILLKDSVENIDTQRKVMRIELNHKFEKKAVADSISFVKQQELISTKEAGKRYALYGVFIFSLILLSIYFRVRIIKKKIETEGLLEQIKLLKANSIAKLKMGSSIMAIEDLELNKEKIEAAIQRPLNQSDWSVLKALYKNPVITNKEIAEEVSLSTEGVRSSLKKMYRLFNINKDSKDLRISLIIVATKISGE